MIIRSGDVICSTTTQKCYAVKLVGQKVTLKNVDTGEVSTMSKGRFRVHIDSGVFTLANGIERAKNRV